MSVQRKTITVTAEQDLWIKSQVENGQYGNDSEYIRDLIRKDHEDKIRLKQLRDALIAGEQSGVSNKTMESILTEAKQRRS
jgi:antitoxin ParD1/3/4